MGLPREYLGGAQVRSLAQNQRGSLCAGRRRGSTEDDGTIVVTFLPYSEAHFQWGRFRSVMQEGLLRMERETGQIADPALRPPRRWRKLE